MEQSEQKKEPATTKWHTKEYITKHPQEDYAKVAHLVQRESYLVYMLFGMKYPLPNGTPSGIRNEWEQCGIVKSAQEVQEMLEELRTLQQTLAGVNADMLHCATCLCNNKRQRVHRIKPRLIAVEEHSKNKKGKVRGLFLTLTFNDEFLQATTYEERRAIVIEFVQSTGARYYVGNLDYGKKNGREHYHFVVDVSKVDPKEYMSRTMGSNIDFERIRGSLTDQTQIESDTKKCIASYLVKLTNHALKATTHSSRIIYSPSLRGMH